MAIKKVHWIVPYPMACVPAWRSRLFRSAGELTCERLPMSRLRITTKLSEVTCSNCLGTIERAYYWPPAEGAYAWPPAENHSLWSEGHRVLWARYIHSLSSEGPPVSLVCYIHEDCQKNLELGIACLKEQMREVTKP